MNPTPGWQPHYALFFLTMALPAQGTPLLPATPSWSRLGTLAFEQTGASARAAGDVDGDGIGDLLVLSPGAAAPSASLSVGKAELFAGTLTGYSLQPMWTVYGVSFTERLDRAAEGIGDVNGDGFADLGFASSRVESSVPAGGVYVFYGGPAGPNGGVDARLTDADWQGYGARVRFAGFGHSILGPGDVTGDGIDDLLVGVSHFTSSDQAHVYEGAVALFPGTSNGLTGGPTAAFADSTWHVEANATHAYLGQRLHRTGDVDGDGIADFAVTANHGPGGASHHGVHYVFRGAPGGPAGGGLASAYHSVAGAANTARLGRDLAIADFDGDGRRDLVIAYPNGNYNGLEPLELWRGVPGGFVQTAWRPTAGNRVEGLGVELAVGDFDGDTRLDLAVHSRSYVPPGTNVARGRVRVFRGTGGAFSEPLEAFPTWEYVPADRPGVATQVLANVGDPEADGTDTLAIGMPQRRAGTSYAAGKIELFARPGETFDPCPVALPDWEFVGAVREGLGADAVLGDFDGDGFDDLLTGNWSPEQNSTAPHLRVFSGSPVGLAQTPTWTASIGHAASHHGVVPVGSGDVNGDGFDDALVLVRGSSYSPQGVFTPGAAFLFLGSAGGLLAAPSWSAAPQSSAPLHFARTGAIVGDLNGDGFDDLAIGAQGTARQRAHWPSPFDIAGRVHVYYGSPAGPLGGVPGDEHNADWTATHPDTTGHFGRTIRSAGDLDGDGCDELLVAAPFLVVAHGYEGALYLYRGAPQGVNGGVPGTSGNAAWSLTGTMPGEVLGLRMQAGVDVTEDGVPDLAIAHRTGPFGSVDERIELWAGAPAGFGNAPHQTLRRSDRLLFGLGVALVGDFDGDGNGDLAVTSPASSARSPRDGRIDLLRGVGDRMIEAATWRGTGRRSQALLGNFGLLLAGDVNGDGLSDLVTGAPNDYRQSQSELRGSFAAFYGTRRCLVDLTPDELPAAAATRIGHLGGLPQNLVGAFVSLDGNWPFGTLNIPLAIGLTDAESCWLFDYQLPGPAMIGQWRIGTAMYEPGYGVRWSPLRVLTVR